MNKTDREKEINLLNELIDKSSNEKIKMLSKNGLNIQDLKHFDSLIVEKLSKTKTNLSPRKYTGYNIPPTKIGIEGTVIEYSNDKKSLLFNLAIIKKHLNKIEK